MTESLLILIPALPLLAAVLTACFGRRLKERSHWPVVIAMALGVSVEPDAVEGGEFRRQLRFACGIRRGPHRLRRDVHALELGRRSKCLSGACLARFAGRSENARVDGRDADRRRRAAGSRSDAELFDRRYAPRRPADGHHALDGHVHLVAGGHLFDRLHARRSRAIGGSSATSACSCFR